MTNTSSLTNVQFPLPGVNKNNRTLAGWHGRLLLDCETLNTAAERCQVRSYHRASMPDTAAREGRRSCALTFNYRPDQKPEEQGTKTNQAVFLEPDEVLARVGVKGIDEIEYTFAEPRPFYLRLIPTTARRERLKYSELSELVRQRRLDAFPRTVPTGRPRRHVLF